MSTIIVDGTDTVPNLGDSPHGPPKDLQRLVFKSIDSGVSDAEKDRLLGEYNVEQFTFKMWTKRYAKRKRGETMLARAEAKLGDADRLIAAGSAETMEFHRRHPLGAAGPNRAFCFRSEDSDLGNTLLTEAIDERFEAWRLLGRPDIPGHDPQSARPDLVRSYVEANQAAGPLQRERNELAGKYRRDIPAAVRKMSEAKAAAERLVERALDGDTILNHEMPTWGKNSAFWMDTEAKARAAGEPTIKSPEAVVQELRQYLTWTRKELARVERDRLRVEQLDGEIVARRRQAREILGKITDAKVGMNWGDVRISLAPVRVRAPPPGKPGGSAVRRGVWRGRAPAVRPR